MRQVRQRLNVTYVIKCKIDDVFLAYTLPGGSDPGPRWQTYYVRESCLAYVSLGLCNIVHDYDFH